MNQNLLAVIQTILGVILIVLVLVQVKGTGLGSTFGGEIGFYRTKRGFEKLLFYFTIAIAGLFLISAIIRLLL